MANRLVSIFIIREVATGETEIQELTEKPPVEIEQESQKVSLCLLHVMCVSLSYSCKHVFVPFINSFIGLLTVCGLVCNEA